MYLKMQEQPDGSGLTHMLSCLPAFDNVVRLLQPGHASRSNKVSSTFVKTLTLWRDSRVDRSDSLKVISTRDVRAAQEIHQTRLFRRAKSCDLDLCPS